LHKEQFSTIDSQRRIIKRPNRKLKKQTNAKEVLIQNVRNNINNVSSCNDVVDLFLKNLRQISSERNRNLNKLANFVVDILWDSELLDGLFLEKLLEKAKQHFRETIFSPSNILRAMDMCGGTLSM
jgi:hypothetical protein